MTIKLNEQQAYCEAIQILFGGAVKATPDQINSNVIEHVDIMIKELAKCSEAITEIAFRVIYEAAISKVVGHLLSKIADGFTKEALEYQLNKKVSELLLDWVQKLTANRRFVGCVYKARVNWRSVIEMDLLGI